MRVDVMWEEGVSFRAKTESGHSFLMDGTPAHGGKNRGARPMEALLAGAAGCSAFDVVHILKKARQPFTHVSVVATGERAQETPKVFTHIHLHFVVSNSRESAVKQAVDLSVGTYCSALRMLAASCKITSSWEITVPDKEESIFSS